MSAKGRIQVEKKESGVELRHHGSISWWHDNNNNEEEEDGRLSPDWPNGSMMINMLHNSVSETISDEIQGETFDGRNGEYWQASVRLALLRKYGVVNNDNNNPKANKEMLEDLSQREMEEIDRLWRNAANGSNEELKELLRTRRSNHRSLRWTTMMLPSHLQLSLHAHPNIEVIYSVRGTLHEIRMDGPPLVEDEEGEYNLRELERSWTFHSLPQGRWLVNETGSIHKSFSTTPPPNNDNDNNVPATSSSSSILLVLWGVHADISMQNYPKSVNVPHAVDEMEEKLSSLPPKDDPAVEIQQTFLPEFDPTKRKE